MTVSSKTRVYGLDVLKAICAFLILTIHAPFPGEIGTYLTVPSRAAVPIFFMITGYFYPDSRQNNRELTHIRKIILLALKASCLYLVLGILIRLHSGALEFILQCFRPKSILRFFLFGDSPFYEHLWYLNAVIAVLVIVFFLYRWLRAEAESILFLSIIPLLAVNLLLGSYSFSVMRRYFPYVLIRNFAFTGLPYFSIGLFMRRHGVLPLPKAVLFMGTVLFSVTSILENYLLYRTGLSSTQEHYISTFFLSVFLFSLCLNSNPGNHLGFLQAIGQKHSTAVYILHPIIIEIVDTAGESLHIPMQTLVLRPVVMYCASVLVSMAWLSIYASLRRYISEKAHSSAFR